MTEPTQKTNWFVRILIVIFCVILVWMVYTSFTKSSSPFSLNASIITLIAIITIVILSESFNNLSVGQLITLSRKVEKTEKENDKLAEENSKLNLQIVQMAQIVTNFRQTQISSNTPINITSFDFAQLLGQKLGVVKANQEEISEVEKISAVAEETTIAKVKDTFPEGNKRLNSRLRSFTIGKIRKIYLNKFIEKNNIPLLSFQKDIRFSESFEKIDPISDKSIVFDGYLSTSSKEYFFDCRTSNVTANPIFWDRLYIALAKILFYRQAKSIQADLTLINVEIPEEKVDRNSYSIERFFEVFQPAIANNLLKIETIKLSMEEYEEIMKTVAAENPQAAA